MDIHENISMSHQTQNRIEMNILIDGRALARNSAGVSYFLKNALEEWICQSPLDRFYIYIPYNVAETLKDKRLEVDNVKYIMPRFKVPKQIPNIIKLQIDIPHLCHKFAIDCYFTPVPHIPYGIPHHIKKIIIVHDVVNIEMTSTMTWTNRLATKLFFTRSVKKADLIWANSHYTKKMIDKYFPTRKSTKIFVGGAADRKVYHKKQISHECQLAIKKKYGIREKFILFVGSLEPRKNLTFLLSMMPQLYKYSNVQLVVVGANKWKSSSIFNIVNSKGFPRESTIFCNYISDSDLADLYNIADLFVSPSLTEGLGLPQIEALLCGCPIITSENTAMAEVANGKEGAKTIKGYNPEMWISEISRALTDRPVVNVEQMKEYNWTVIIDNFRKEIHKLWLKSHNCTN